MTPVIRRKIDRSRQPAAEGAPGADRGWRLGLARAARDMLGLPVEFRRLQVHRLSLTEVLELPPDHALVAMLDGPQGALGALFLSPAVTSAVIEMQTLGRLTNQPGPARRPTRIDAAMVAGLIDRALTGLDEALVEELDRTWAAGFRYASFLDDPRPLHLMLEDEPYRVLVADLAIGELGQRTGQAILALPAQGRGERPLARPEDGTQDLPQFTAALAGQVMQVECRLDAIIGRLTLPLAQIMALQPGQVLGLGSAALDAVTLEASDGRRMARARLGQNRGMRAVKLVEAGAEGEGRPTQGLGLAGASAPPAAETAAALRAVG